MNTLKTIDFNKSLCSKCQDKMAEQRMVVITEELMEDYLILVGKLKDNKDAK